jgi:DNA adenine methylase
MERPLLRWAGSKRQQLPRIRQCWPPEFSRYIEPFCGSCAALSANPGVPAIMNDINPELINFWRILQDKPKELHAAIAAFPIDEITYYEVRALKPAELSDFDRASRFGYLNRYSFNGLYRTNRKGEFNVPFGGRRMGSVPPVEQYVSVSSRFKNVEFHCSDFELFLSGHVKKGDFIYLDPPYVLKGSRVAGGYDIASFGERDVDRLVGALHSLDKAGALFLLSYAPDCRLESELAEFYKGTYPVVRRISGFRKGRTSTFETMFSNF